MGSDSIISDLNYTRDKYSNDPTMFVLGFLMSPHMVKLSEGTFLCVYLFQSRLSQTRLNAKTLRFFKRIF